MYIRRRFVKSRNITEVIFKNVFSLIIYTAFLKKAYKVNNIYIIYIIYISI